MTVSTEPAADTAAAPPSVRRRLLCFLYEGVLLFGIVMMVGLIYGLLTQQRQALVGSTGLKATLFVVLGLYFSYFWTRSGQTLAMLTWHVQVVRLDGRTPRPGQALLRYVLSWLWFLPALAIAHFSGINSAGPATVVLLSGVAAYAALARLRQDRQFFHDVVCQTRLITRTPLPKTKRT